MPVCALSSSPGAAVTQLAVASQEYGGAVVASSDDFYSSASMLNRPDCARTMGERWETQRRRGTGHDFALFRLAFAGCLRRVVIDTAHFKYNASAAIALYGCAAEVPPEHDSSSWRPLVDRASAMPEWPARVTAPTAAPVLTGGGP